jgi:hypothetical protein
MMTLIANLRHAARNRETVTIGGGEFGPAELLEAARVLELHSQLLGALKASLDWVPAHLNSRRLAEAAIAQATGVQS